MVSGLRPQEYNCLWAMCSSLNPYLCTDNQALQRVELEDLLSKRRWRVPWFKRPRFRHVDVLLEASPWLMAVIFFRWHVVKVINLGLARVKRGDRWSWDSACNHMGCNNNSAGGKIWQEPWLHPNRITRQTAKIVGLKFDSNYNILKFFILILNRWLEFWPLIYFKSFVFFIVTL